MGKQNKFYMIQLFKNNLGHFLGNDINSLEEKHPFHLVGPSSWPILAAIGRLTLTMRLVMYIYNSN